MNYLGNWFRSALACLALLAGLGLHATSAFGQAATADFLAGGTVTSGGISANTDVSNTATLSYQINGAAQPNITSAASQFKVDKIVNLSVTRVTAAHVAVAPNAAAQVIQFTVTNTGNAIEDFQLTAANMASTTAITIGATTYTDNFDVGSPTACQAFVESGTNPTQYDAGIDTAKAIVSLSPATGSNQRTVWVVCDIPNQASGDALVSLTAQAFKATTCSANVTTTGLCTVGQNETATAGPENATIVEVVLNDGAAASPVVPGDAVRDGKLAAVGVYRIVNSAVQVTKTLVTICDPVNFSTNPRAIPGAFVRYTITVANFTALPLPTASATLTQIQDSINTALLNFDSNFVQGSVSTVPPANCTTPESAGNAYNVRCGVAAGSGATNGRPSGAGQCGNAAGQFFPNGGGGAALNFASPTITALLNLVLPQVGSPTCPTASTPSAAGAYCAGELKPGETVSISFNVQIK